VSSDEPQLDLDAEIVLFPGATPVVPPLVDALVARLRADPSLDAAGTFVPVLDAVKTVGSDGTVTGGVDRTFLGHLGRPLAVRRQALDPVTGQPRIDRFGVV
jgi:hypothetical protein